MTRVSKEIIRVLQIGMHDKIGGVETFLMTYYRNIDRDKIQFDFINPYQKLCFCEEIKELGGKIFDVPNFKKNPIKYYYALKKIIRNNDYDIVHVNMLSAANIIPLIAAKRSGVKVIIAHSHNNELPRNVIKRTLNIINKHFISKLANAFFACSDIAGKWMFGSNSKFEVICNAIDFNKFKFDEQKRNELRKKYNLEDKFVVGHIGRFSDQKNHLFLVDVFNEIKKNKPNSVLLMVGEGELENDIKQKIDNLGLSDSVIFYGVTNDVNSVFQIFDIFLLPSKYEGLGIVLIEAQATGLQCYTSKDVVPASVNYTGCVNFISLDISPKKWSSEILNAEIQKRNSTYSDYYDINKQAKILEEKYKKLLENR